MIYVSANASSIYQDTWVDISKAFVTTGKGSGAPQWIGKDARINTPLGGLHVIGRWLSGWEG